MTSLSQNSDRWIRCRGQLPGGPAGDREIQVVSAICWTNLSREQSSLTFFYKIHSGTVSLDKNKNLTQAPNIRSIRASHESQYTRYLAYSEALKNSFFPRTISIPVRLFQCEIVSLPRWSHPRPLRSLRLLYTAAFTYYYDPAISRNKFTPLSIFRDLALRKRDSKKINCLLQCVLYGEY